VKLKTDLLTHRFFPLLWLTIAIWAGCASDNSSSGVEHSAKPMASAPAASAKLVPSSDVSRVQAWKDAERVSQMGEGRASAAGSGGSMQPVFGDNTMIVISKIAYEELQPGMTIAYLNRKGHQVVHQIQEKTTGGWRVHGLNNETEDLDLVTRENLLGVVYASFAAEEP